MYQNRRLEAMRLALAMALVAMLAVIALPQATYADPDWYDTSWAYRRAVTIDHTEVEDVADPSTTYANFPVLVYATGLSNIKAGGADIRFTSSDGTTELPREIESYSSGTLYAWVKVTLTKDASNSTDDVIYMYYGNGSASEPAPDSTYGSENVWDSSFEMVLHLDETSGTHYDSTSNDNDASVTGTPNQNAAGQIAGGIEFTGVASEWIASSSALDTSNAFTIELWGNYQLTSSYQTGIWYQTSGSAWKELITIDDSGDIMSWWDGGDSGVDLGTDWDYDEWHKYVFAYDGSTMYIYKDGQYSSQVTTDYNSATGIDHWEVGDREDTSQPLDGTVDEYRFSTTNRSAEWIKTSYNNQDAPASFCNMGTEEEQPNSDPTVDTVGIYETNHATTVTAMTPQMEYAVKVTVTDDNTLADLSTVKVTIFYDADGSYDAGDVPTSGNTQTAAILTCMVGGTPSWEIDPSASTTWTIESDNCVQPTLTNTTGDFWFHFKPGKVAIETTGSAKWHIYAKADDGGGSPGDNYQDSRTMNWYGEIAVNTGSIDWGSLAPGVDFEESSKQTGISVTYITNGAYDEQVAASTPWTDGGSNSAALDIDGSPAGGSFSAKADDTDALGSAVFVATTSAYATIDDSGGLTSESGDTVNTNTLWLALGIPFVDATYDGTIYYKIADGS